MPGARERVVELLFEGQADNYSEAVVRNVLRSVFGKSVQDGESADEAYLDRVLPDWRQLEIQEAERSVPREVDEDAFQPEPTDSLPLSASLASTKEEEEEKHVPEDHRYHHHIGRTHQQELEGFLGFALSEFGITQAHHFRRTYVAGEAKQHGLHLAHHIGQQQHRALASIREEERREEERRFREARKAYHTRSWAGGTIETGPWQTPQRHR